MQTGRQKQREEVDCSRREVKSAGVLVKLSADEADQQRLGSKDSSAREEMEAGAGTTRSQRTDRRGEGVRRAKVTTTFTPSLYRCSPWRDMTREVAAAAVVAGHQLAASV